MRFLNSTIAFGWRWIACILFNLNLGWIAYVFNYLLYWQGDAENDKECQQHPTLMKVIVETSAFPNTTHIEKSSQGIMDTVPTCSKLPPEKSSLSAVRAFGSTIVDMQKQVVFVR